MNVLFKVVKIVKLREVPGSNTSVVYVNHGGIDLGKNPGQIPFGRGFIKGGI